MDIRISEILTFLDSIEEDYKFSGNREAVIHNYAPLKELKNDSIIWARSNRYLNSEELEKYHNLLLVMNDSEKHVDINGSIIRTQDPYRAFFKILAHFWVSDNYEAPQIGIANSAIILTKKIGENVYVGEGSFIDEDVVIGNNVTIQHNVTIQGKVKIGDGTLIQSGTAIGSSGFGYLVEKNGDRTCIPHLGGVLIGKNVRIGSLACIQRGCLSDTIIEDNVCIDNLVHISHNDVIRKGAMVVVGTVIAGSVEVGETCWLGPGTIVNDGVCVADRTYSGTGTVITKDTSFQKVVVGVPAKELRDRDMRKDLD